MSSKSGHFRYDPEAPFKSYGRRHRRLPDANKLSLQKEDCRASSPIKLHAHIKLHSYFSVPTWKPDLRSRLQLAIRQATQESSRSGRIMWKIGAYDGINQSFWIPQISQLSKVVYTCSFKTPGALMGRFVAFTEMKQGLSWIRNVRIRVDAE